MKPQTNEGKLPAVREDSGFSLVEFLIATLILLIVSASVFSMMAETQRAASYQTEVQAVLENSRIAMDTATRIIRQAGNNPSGAAFAGVTIVGPQEVRICSDLTGSAPGQPDQGDPDGDILDAGEDISIRYDAATQSLMLVTNGNPQPVADHIGGFTMQYLDTAGNPTAVGNDVRRIRITITGATTLRNPQTGQIFSMAQTSDAEILTRR